MKQFGNGLLERTNTELVMNNSFRKSATVRHKHRLHDSRNYWGPVLETCDQKNYSSSTKAEIPLSLYIERNAPWKTIISAVRHCPSLPLSSPLFLFYAIPLLYFLFDTSHYILLESLLGESSTSFLLILRVPSRMSCCRVQYFRGMALVLSEKGRPLK